MPRPRPSDPLDILSFAAASSLADIPELSRSMGLQAIFGLSFAKNLYPPFKRHREQKSSISSQILTPITNYNRYFPLSDFYFIQWYLKD